MTNNSEAVRISVTITPQQAEFIRKLIEQGDYSSTSEVIRAAIRELKRKFK